MIFRIATPADIPELTALNAALIRDENHRSSLTIEQLEQRMRRFFGQGHVAVLFIDQHRTVGS